MILARHHISHRILKTQTGSFLAETDRRLRLAAKAAREAEAIAKREAREREEAKYIEKRLNQQQVGHSTVCFHIIRTLETMRD